MTRTLINILALLFLISWGLPTVASGQDSVPKNGELTIPWDEFKDLLNLDDDKIVITQETFQKLLAQTGVKTAPPHSVQAGHVVLTRAEFKSLVDKMIPPVDAAVGLPFDFLITRAIYSGSMQNRSTTFTGTFTVHVLKKDAYIRVPLLPKDIALEDIKVGGRPGLVISENGYHSVVLSEAGEYSVTATFSLKSSLEKGPNKIDLAIQQTPITLLRLEMPLKNIDVEIPQAQQIVTGLRGNKTNIAAVIIPGRAISIRWRKEVTPTEKIPSKLYSEVYHLVSIEDDALRINSDINLNILHSELDGVRLTVPQQMHVLTVTGEGVGEWQELTHEDEHTILIPFTYGKKGAMTIRVTAELALSETGLANAFGGLQVLESVKETGYIGVVLNTSAEVTVADRDGLEQVAALRLPRQIVDKSTKPLTMGFKYLKHPYSLVLDIKKHEKISVPVATINSANAVTLFTEDGKVVHRLVYQVRNSAKQFLQVQVPEAADVWSVYVDNAPVESSISAEGKLLVPLIRSRSEAGGLDTFPVEVIYCVVEDRFSWLDSRGASLPAVDLLVSQLIWSVYLPNDYAYHYFTSTLEIEEMIRGLNVFAGPQRQYDERAMRQLSTAPGYEQMNLSREEMKQAYGDKDYKSKFKNVPLKEEEISSQVAQEFEFSGRLEGLTRQDIAPTGGTGILPIQIQVPTGGQVYRFARTIINTDDELAFEVVYSRSWVSALLKWIIILLIVLILYLNRKTIGRLWRWIYGKWKVMADLYKGHSGSIKRWAKSALTPFVLFGLAILFWPFVSFLSLLFLFLFWVSVVYHFLEYVKKRTQVKAKPKSQPQ